jgi:hypothetical protein
LKLIIAGTRDFAIGNGMMNALLVHFGLEEKVKEIVSGGARGVDSAGESWAKEMKQLCGENALVVTLFPADWTKHGKAAGPIRNKEMAEYSDALLLIWDGKSKGSANMRSQMVALKKPIFEVILDEPTR